MTACDVPSMSATNPASAPAASRISRAVPCSASTRSSTDSSPSRSASSVSSRCSCSRTRSAAASLTRRHPRTMAQPTRRATAPDAEGPPCGHFRCCRPPRPVLALRSARPETSAGAAAGTWRSRSRIMRPTSTPTAVATTSQAAATDDDPTECVDDGPLVAVDTSVLRGTRPCPVRTPGRVTGRRRIRACLVDQGRWASGSRSSLARRRREPSYLVVPGRADNAARDDLGPKTAIMIRQTRPKPVQPTSGTAGPSRSSASTIR